MKIALESVDSVTITTLVDNYVDMLLVDQGPAKRPGLPTADTPRVPATVLEEGQTTDAPLAEHGFSAMITVTIGDREHRVLFDTGMTPGGLVENMRRLGHSTKDIEAIVLSHGHFDHTTGLDGIIRTLGRPSLPVFLHPEAWSRRRLVLPGREPFEIPTPSKSAIKGAGFEIIEEEQPSFLLDGSLLITGEVDRTTEFEKGFPVHQAKRNGDWQPDPLILDDQAAILNVRDKGLVVLTGCGHAGIVNIFALRPQAHRCGSRLRGDGRVPPQRALIRADHSAGLRCTGGSRPSGDRSGTLHRVEGRSCPGCSVPEHVYPE